MTGRRAREAIARLFELALAVGFLAIVSIDTNRLATFFSHALLTERSGVSIRPVTLQGAQLVRIAALIAAVGWCTIPPLIRRVAQPMSLPIARQHTSHRQMLLLGVILLLGLTERVWRLSESLWFDEISALIDYAQYGPGAIVATYFVPSNHVLHTLLSWGAITLAGGVSEPILRFPALLAGLATIPAVAMLARECLLWRVESADRPSVSLTYLAAALATLCPILVLESVEARGYSLMILFSALASTHFLRGWRTGSGIAWIVYTLLCALGIWSHLTFVALPASHALIATTLALQRTATAHDRAAAKAAFASLALAAITVFALLAPLLPELFSIRSEFQALDGDEPSLLSREGFHVILGLGGSWTLWSAIPGCALCAIGIARSRHDQARRVPLAVTLCGLPLLVVATALAGSWMYARFALFALPGAVLAIALGLLDLGSKRLVTGATITLAAAWTISLAYLPQKQPIRDAVAFIDERDTSATSVASAGLPDNVVAYYGVLRGLDIANAGSGGRDIAALPLHTRWLIVLYPQSLTTEGRAAIARDWTHVHTFLGWVDWTNGDVVVYSRRITALP